MTVVVLCCVPLCRFGFWQENNDTHFHDTETGVELEVTDKQSLVEWIANSYKNFGATLEFITNRSVSSRPLFAFTTATGRLHLFWRHFVPVTTLAVFFNRVHLFSSLYWVASVVRTGLYRRTVFVGDQLPEVSTIAVFFLMSSFCRLSVQPGGFYPICVYFSYNGRIHGALTCNSMTDSVGGHSVDGSTVSQMDSKTVSHTCFLFLLHIGCFLEYTRVVCFVLVVHRCAATPFPSDFGLVALFSEMYVSSNNPKIEQGASDM